MFLPIVMLLTWEGVGWKLSKKRAATTVVSRMVQIHGVRIPGSRTSRHPSFVRRSFALWNENGLGSSPPNTLILTRLILVGRIARTRGCGQMALETQLGETGGVVRDIPPPSCDRCEGSQGPGAVSWDARASKQEGQACERPSSRLAQDATTNVLWLLLLVVVVLLLLLLL